MAISKFQKLTPFCLIILFLIIGCGGTNSPDVANTIPLKKFAKTDYFEIVVQGAEVVKMVNTGNEFSDLKEENGNVYLVFNVAFKNIDSESRLFDEGYVLINYNGKDYTFDKSEVVMAEGYGSLFDQLNPLTSKVTNLVYKIPAEITGDVFWIPGRNSNGVTFKIGNITHEVEN